VFVGVLLVVFLCVDCVVYLSGLGVGGEDGQGQVVVHFLSFTLFHFFLCVSMHILFTANSAFAVTVLAVFYIDVYFCVSVFMIVLVGWFCR